MNMIERVAVAIFDSVVGQELTYAETIIMARAAIEAMREPTERMLQAAYALHKNDTFWDNSTCPPQLATKLGVAGPRDDYRAMIDAALKPDTEE